MTRFFLVLAAIGGCMGAATSRTSAADPVRNALPAHARLLALIAIPAQADEYAVTYKLHGSYLAVADASRGAARLVWTRKLPGPPATLTSPGPSGLFQVTVRRAGSAGGWLLAFIVRSDQVMSGVKGRPAGFVYGDEGVQVKGRSFSVLARQLDHVGSVRYRTVTQYIWKQRRYRVTRIVHVPDYPPNRFPLPNGLVHTQAGDVVLVRLEVATTPQQRETGLMNRPSLDPDSGMVFVWDRPVSDGFWMYDTYIPLTVAFLDANGRIMETQDMAPLSTAVHYPSAPYMYAVEVNQGFFSRHEISVGDQVELHLTSQVASRRALGERTLAPTPRPS